MDNKAGIPVNDPRRPAIGYALLVVAAGLNLRDPITSVAATLDSVSRQYALGTVEAAMLSSLPVLILAAGAPVAPLLERRIGPERTVLALAMLLVVSVALRPLDKPALFLGTVVGGAAISGLSVLMPQLIRDRLGGRIGLWTGVFTTSFGVSAALGAALTVPLVSLLGSLPLALAAWAAPAVVLSGVAAVVVRSGPKRVTTPAVGRPGRLRPSPLLWQLTGFFGAQAMVFFATTAWLPTLYTDRGLTPRRAALLLALAGFAGLPASLGISVLAARLRRQHTLVALVSAGSAVGLAGIAWAPASAAPAFVILLGAAQGAAFGLAVALIVLKTEPGVSVAQFSAFAQGAGYALAAMGPMLVGLLRSVRAPWSLTIGMLIVVVAAQAAAGWAAGRRVMPSPTSTPASADDGVDRPVDALLTDRSGGTQLLRPQTHPQFLDHPCDVTHIGSRRTPR